MSQHEIQALGWLAQELSNRAGGPHLRPSWFPEPPEWLELWSQAWKATEEGKGDDVWENDGTFPQDGDSLQEDIRSAINRHSAENTSNTPDFILTMFLLAALDAFDRSVARRDEWYDMHPSPGGVDGEMWLVTRSDPATDEP